MKNFEGLHLYSGMVLPLDNIKTEHFPDLDCLAVKPVGIKILSEGGRNVTLLRGKKDLERSFPQHVHIHPTRKGWLISNWSKFFQKSFL